MNKNKNFAGFTLIELLVVIVIIGILATISVSTFQGYFEKARLAKAQFSASQIKSLFLAQNASTEEYLFTMWYSADEDDDIRTTSPLVRDKSSEKNHLTHMGYPSLPFSQSEDTGAGVGKSIRIENRSLFRWSGWASNSNYPIDKITIATWIKMNNFPSAHQHFFQFAGSSGLRIYPDGGIAFYINTYNNLKSPIKSIKQNEWHYVIGSYNGENEEMKLWIDGDLVGTKKGVPQTVEMENRSVYMGTPGFNGWLDEVMVLPYSFDGKELK